MSWLLDTHALIRALFVPGKLGRKTRGILKDPANDVRVSPLRYWEISLKFGLGKLALPDTDPSEIPTAARQLGLREDPLEFFAARIDFGKEADTGLDFPPCGDCGKALVGLHGEFLGGHGVRPG